MTHTTQAFGGIFIVIILLFVIFWTYIRYMRISKGRTEAWYSKAFWILLFSSVVSLILLILAIYVM